VDSLARLLDLNDVVREELGRRIDRGEPTANHDRRKADLKVRERRALVRAGELKGHQEVARLADAAREVVLERDDRRPARARSDPDVLEAESPRIFEVDRAAEANAAVRAEEPLTRERDVEDGEEVLVPANGDAVFAHTAEAEEHALIELEVHAIE